MVAWRWPSDALPPAMQAKKEELLAAWPPRVQPLGRMAVGKVMDPLTSRRARPAMTFAAAALLLASVVGGLMVLDR